MIIKDNGDADKEEDLQKEEVYTTERDKQRSPPKRCRKKSAKAKNYARKEGKATKKSGEKKEKATKEDSRKEGEEKQTSAGAEPEGETAEDTPTPSAMREGKFNPGCKVTEIKPSHNHKHERIFIEDSTESTNDQKHIEFTMKMRGLYKEEQKVDETIIINPIASGTKGSVITKRNDTSLNHTDLGANVKVADNASFQKRRPWGRGKEDIPEEDWKDPEV